MKLKTYSGDLSILESCIKISCKKESDVFKILKELNKKKIPYDMDDNLSIFVSFKDYLMSSLDYFGSRNIKVSEYIKPIGLEVKLKRYEYIMQKGNSFYVYYNSIQSYVKFGKKDEKISSWTFPLSSYWYTTGYHTFNMEDYEKGRYKKDRYYVCERRRIMIIASILLRRGLIEDKNIYYNLKSSLDYNPTEIKYYEG